MTNTRKMFKMEKPRVSKTQTSSDQNIERVLNQMDVMVRILNGTTIDASISSHVIALCDNLKAVGSHLESSFKDQLDRCYVCLRNGCRDDRVPLTSRYRLLEVIELRAMNWHPTENLNSYYKQKLANAESKESALEKYPGVENALQYIDKCTSQSVVSERIEPPSDSGSHFSYQIQVTPNQTVIHPAAAPSPPLLQPGETMKSSGRYTAPCRQTGKNQLKDEVVIRNSDSGKVMGIRGKRLHMIEEMSETVISFAKVPPGTKERFVQIMGMSEENINMAKLLIDETIRRNASPVRAEERGNPLNVTARPFMPKKHQDEAYSESDQSGSFDEPVFESNFEDYRYTVSHEDDFICISGSNLDLVKTAKLILDEYFTACRSSSNMSQNGVHSARATGATGASGQNGIDAAKGSVESSRGGVVTLLRQPIIPSSTKETIQSIENGSKPAENECVRRRRLFAKTSADACSPPDQSKISESFSALATNSPSLCGVGGAGTLARSPASPERKTRRMYTRTFLVKCSSSPSSQTLPPAFHVQGFKNSTIARKEINHINADDLLRSDIKWTILKSISGSSDEDEHNT